MRKRCVAGCLVMGCLKRFLPQFAQRVSVVMVGFVGGDWVCMVDLLLLAGLRCVVVVGMYDLF